MFNKMLNYWYAQEFFSPCWPVKLKEDCDLNKNDLPWGGGFIESQSSFKLCYDVYFGKIAVADLVDWFQKELGLTSDEESVEGDNSITCLFAIKVDENGQYVANSFAISSLVWAICKLVSANLKIPKLDHRDLDKLQQKVDRELLEWQEETKCPKISKGFLWKLFSDVCDLIQLPNEYRQFAAWSRCKKEYKGNGKDLPPLNPATEIMQSFYLNDIKKVQKTPTDNIRNYVTGLLEVGTHGERIHIDSDTAQMQRWLAAKAFPLGVWPSAYSPSLMQQLGINIAISHEQKIFSVNGPPGTGKTTLLKEIVVSNVVQRAIVLSGYSFPSEAFKKTDFQNPIDQYSQSFYQMDSELSAYGMIVASNNNAAVENVSTELPKLISKDRTGLFSSASQSTYFADIASKLLGEPAWGLISARLGRKRNLSELKERLWWADDGVTLKRYYEENSNGRGTLPSWSEARKAFQTALNAVESDRRGIEQAQASLVSLNEAEKRLEAAQFAESSIRKQYTQQRKQLESKIQKLNQMKDLQRAEEANNIQLKARIPFLKRVFQRWFKNDPVILEWKNSTKQIGLLEIEIVNLQREITFAQNSLVPVENKLKLQVEETKHAKKHLEAAQKVTEEYRNKYFGSNWADADFWNDITHNKKSQSSCPWTSSGYDMRREELFYRALMLHKVFILSSNEVKQNLTRLFAVWDGKITGDDRNSAYSHLLNTLMLMIPVISTTFASVESFLDGIGAEELGMLIIDEAGQATPQSALGAIWRTRRAIIVGDPLQVEPIVTVPSKLRKYFADGYNLPSEYRSPDISVQLLADSVNLYGGSRELAGRTLWLGCPLVTHRRCRDPMFSISNEVAYDKRMFFKTAPPKAETKFLLQKSLWIDCGGTEVGNKNHTVHQQIDLAGRLFEKAIRVYNGLPDLYLITPFTTVAFALSAKLNKVITQTLPELGKAEGSDWVAQHCGTVHTFQGKEAAEVLFVLGCDEQSGYGAAQWVGQKPNIVNVAVSRAKYRIGVIGDYTLWAKIPYVKIICSYLERMVDYDSVLS